jgi:hypothetical protein
MQQFTLDAITASGNSSMTDAQKWALNHLFYTLGKFDDSENSIWNKISYIFLPIISTSVDHSCIDYVDNVNRGDASYYSELELVDKGLKVAENGSGKYSVFVKNGDTNVRPVNISIFRSVSSVNDNNQIKHAGMEGNTSRYVVSSFGIGQDGKQKFYAMVTGQSTSAIDTIATAGVIQNFNCSGAETDLINGYVVTNNNDIIQATCVFDSNNYTPVSVIDKHVITIVKDDKTSPVQMMIVAECLPSTTARSIVDAMNKLRNAFMV